MADPAQHPPATEPAAGNALLDQMAQQHLAGAAPPVAEVAPAADAPAAIEDVDAGLSSNLESELAALLTQVQSAMTPDAAPAPTPAAAPANDPIDTANIDALISSEAEKIVAAASVDALPPLDPPTQTAESMSPGDIDALLQADSGSGAAAPVAEPVAAAAPASDVQEKLTEADSVLEAELQRLMSQSLSTPPAVGQASDAAASGAVAAAPIVDAQPELSTIGVPDPAGDIAPPEMMEGEIESVAPSRRRRVKRTGPLLLARVGKMFVDLFLMLLQLLDMPFTDVPAEIKSILGVAGLTLATTGVAMLGYVFIKH